MSTLRSVRSVLPLVAMSAAILVSLVLAPSALAARHATSTEALQVAAALRRASSCPSARLRVYDVRVSSVRTTTVLWARATVSDACAGNRRYEVARWQSGAGWAFWQRGFNLYSLPCGGAEGIRRVPGPVARDLQLPCTAQ